MTTSLSETQQKDYWREGYLAPLPALEPDRARNYRAALEAAEAQAGEAFDRGLRHKPHLVWNWADELIRETSVLDAVEGILGPDILCWESALFTKDARSSSYISWHQDITYWGLEAEGNVVTAWIALSPSTRLSGCMRVVPGTHTERVIEHRDTHAADNLLSRGQELAVDVDEADAVDIELQPGQMSLHHVKIFHGSNPNRSDDRRIGFAVRYIPPHLRQQAGTADSARLVRGEDNFGHFELEQPPAGDFSAQALAAHKRLRDQRMAIMMR
ncbi:MAG: phytanoyl-CoA dioxygenase family protein [Geminicoccaceae bacterium]|nr:phytanoyl-CoA dioxygenase family protein [Geminicoccaceae bacterium]MCB9942976.1 phytanoyl-CoA dioxygenase family protein [Geminicoccaceae bacterium]